MELGQSRKEYVDLSRLTYLIVERDHSMRALLLAALRKFNASQIDEATDSNAALDLIEQRHPDVILLGMTQWQVDDMGFLRSIRRSSTSPSSRVPIIVFSDGVCTEDILLALVLGADSHLTVPFADATLEAHLMRALGVQGPE